MELLMFLTASALREACAAIPAATLDAMRGIFVASFDNKLAAMRAPSAQNVAALRRWQRDAEGKRWDASLRVMLASGIPLDYFTRSVRGGGEVFNIYAIPKVEIASRYLLSETPLWDSGESVQLTIRGTICALLDGAHERGGKGVASYLDAFMTERGKGRNPKTGYTSGGTQSASSAHALAALGLLNVPSQGDYRIPEGHARDVLARLAGRES